jgi:hypothetical protein
VLPNRIDDRRERGRANKKDQQPDKYPRHPTHLSPLSRSGQWGTSGRGGDIFGANLLVRGAKARTEAKSAITAEP